MGQYYKIAYEQNDKFYVNNRKIAGYGYVGAKLCEHAYDDNEIVKAVAQTIFKTKTKLMWVGDYVEDEEIGEITRYMYEYGDIYETEDNDIIFPSATFDYHGKYLVNHDTKQYISYDDMFNSEEYSDIYTFSPLVMLTVLGNGQSGSDYYGTHEDLIGKWAWNTISIEEEIPDGFESLNIVFTEDNE